MRKRQIRIIIRDLDDSFIRTVGLENAYRDHRLSEEASLLCLAHGGLLLDPDVVETMACNLANVAEVNGLIPEDVHDILVRHEPSLG